MRKVYYFREFVWIYYNWFNKGDKKGKGKCGSGKCGAKKDKKGSGKCGSKS